MAKLFTTNIDLAKNQLLQAVIEVLAAAPGTPVEGQIYYNSVDDTFYGRNGLGAWLNLGAQGTIGGSITDNQIAIGAAAANTIEGSANFTYDGTIFTVNGGTIVGSATTQDIFNTNATTINLGGAATTLTMGATTGTMNLRNATIALTQVPATDVGFATSTMLVRDAGGNLDKIVASGGGASTFLRADGTWASPGGGFANFTVGADINADQTVNSGDLVEFTSSGAIDTTVTKASTTVTVDFAINTASITNTHLAVMAANTVKANATAGSASPTDVALTTNQVLGRLAANIVGINIIDDDTFGTATASNLATAESIKAYVDASVLGGMTYKGGYNASTDTPSLDDGTPIAGILTGDTYTVTAAGTFFTIPVQIGDVIIAEIDSALVEADWTIVNKNIPDIVSASETAEGIIELATQSEVNTGTDAVRAVTPATLQSKLGVTGSLNSTLRYTAQIGDGVATNIVVTHSIGRQFLTAQVFQTGSPFAQIECDIEMDSTTQTSFTFNVAPTSNQYTVVIVG